MCTDKGTEAAIRYRNKKVHPQRNISKRSGIEIKAPKKESCQAGNKPSEAENA